jgi:hypothetical protein
MTTEMNGAVSPAGDRHPGEIVFEDRSDGRRWTERADENDQTIAWVESDGAWRPVVRVVLAKAERFMEITKFGPNDEPLEHTIAR